MSRLYLKIFIGVIIILAIALSLPTILFQLSPDKGRRPVPFHAKVDLIKRSVVNLSESEIENRLDSLAQLTQFKLSLLDLGDPRIPASAFEKEEPFSRGEPGPPESIKMYIALPEINKALQIEQAFRRPGPDTKTLLIYISITLAIVFVGVFLTIAPTIRNLRKLEIAAQQLGSGKLDWRPDIKSRDAVGNVARQFNQMAEKIQRLIEQERQLLQAVSHELKTPIARMRFITEKLAGMPIERIPEGIADLDNETTEIESLVNELLDYHRFSDSELINKQLFNLKGVLEEVLGKLDKFEPKITRQINGETENDISIKADPVLFKRAMQNLLLNALRFAKSKVIVKYRWENRDIIIEVCDDGPGIPETERERVFKPFARLEDSRSRESGGVGLGLAITQRIVQRHGGTILAKDSDLGGACMTTSWPQDNS
ncbi:MAG: HAMP domain-containing protein [candidate division Zixibacteria bacterium]|nr:HAMP domain-containing protein [candidate division Zixibacteria bacterium]